VFANADVVCGVYVCGGVVGIDVVVGVVDVGIGVGDGVVVDNVVGVDTGRVLLLVLVLLSAFLSCC